MMRRNHKEDDAFVLKRADDEEIKDVLFIHSCVDPIRRFLYVMRRSLMDALTLPFFIAMEDLLT